MVNVGDSKMPKVSIIVLIYNVEKYLNQCLKSLIEQSYDNIEILCVIDGSTDKSLAICHHFAQTDARVKIIYQKNSVDYRMKLATQLVANKKRHSA